MGDQLTSQLKIMHDKRYLEKSLAVAAFVVATALAFVSLLISDDHDIAANVLFVIAQFLLFAASILGLDYKLNGYGSTYPQRSSKQ